MRPQRKRKRLRSYRGEFATRDPRAHGHSARSQLALHRMRIVESFQWICGAPNGARKSKYNADLAAAAWWNLSTVSAPGRVPPGVTKLAGAESAS